MAKRDGTNVADAMADLLNELVDTTNKSGLANSTIMARGFSAEPTEWIPTGVTLLDCAIHGGIPMGRIVELYGQSQSGKSLLGITILGNAQRLGHLVVLIDCERAYSLEFVQRMGRIDTEKLLYCTVDTIEGVFQTMLDIIEDVKKKTEHLKSKPGIVFLWDGVAAVATLGELRKTMVEEHGIAYAARILRRGFRRLVDQLSDNRACLIMTNQTSQKIGASPWQEQEETYGGGGPKFYSSVRIKLEVSSKIGETGMDPTGAWVQATIKKNRLDPPGRKVKFPILYETGVNDIESLVDFLHRREELGSTKGWVIWGEEKCRRKEFIVKCGTDTKLLAAVRAKAIEVYKNPTANAEDTDSDAVQGV